jgi:hypothetical protein
MKDSIASSSQATDIFALEPLNNSEPTTEQDIDSPRRRKRQRIKNPLEMILLSILWMIYPRHFQRHMHH